MRERAGRAFRPPLHHLPCGSRTARDPKYGHDAGATSLDLAAPPLAVAAGSSTSAAGGSTGPGVARRLVWLCRGDHCDHLPAPCAAAIVRPRSSPSRSFVLASPRALHLDRSSRRTTAQLRGLGRGGIQREERGPGSRRSPPSPASSLGDPAPIACVTEAVVRPLPGGRAITPGSWLPASPLGPLSGSLVVTTTTSQLIVACAAI